MGLWNAVQAEYGIRDAGGRELLAQACAALDRAETLAEGIARDGVVVQGKAHPACRDELAARQFVVRTLEKLGVTVEPVKSQGRQPQPLGWIPKEQR